MMGLAAQQEDVSEDPLAKLGYKPLSAPDTPGSRYNFDLARVQAMATAQVNRRDSNVEKVPLTESTGYWLALYFAFNLGLTLYNKVVLVNFPFPYVSVVEHRNDKMLRSIVDSDRVPCTERMCWMLHCTGERGICKRGRHYDMVFSADSSPDSGKANIQGEFDHGGLLRTLHYQHCC